jgi:hypothetical protein
MNFGINSAIWIWNKEDGLFFRDKVDDWYDDMNLYDAVARATVAHPPLTEAEL